MIFEIGDSVTGKDGEELEYCTAVIVEIDEEDKSYLCNVEICEYDDDLVGEQFWAYADDLTLISTLGVSKYVGVTTQADISSLTEVSTMDLFLLGII